MKKTITFCLITLLVLMTGCRDRAVTPEQLPEQVQAFVQQNFPGQNITYAENERKLTGVEYDVVLANGTRIDFNTSGEWEKIECTMMNPVPTVLIPEPIAVYIQANYPDAMILKIDKESYGYEVELANGLEMKFNRQGALMEVDD